jgi:hypothetical protein
VRDRKVGLGDLDRNQGTALAVPMEAPDHGAFSHGLAPTSGPPAAKAALRRNWCGMAQATPGYKALDPRPYYTRALRRARMTVAPSRERQL